jgi:hypothetical protein
VGVPGGRIEMHTVVACCRPCSKKNELDAFHIHRRALDVQTAVDKPEQQIADWLRSGVPKFNLCS